VRSEPDNGVHFLHSFSVKCTKARQKNWYLQEMKKSNYSYLQMI
jgi:hypothetical protein